MKKKIKFTVFNCFAFFAMIPVLVSGDVFDLRREFRSDAAEMVELTRRQTSSGQLWYAPTAQHGSEVACPGCFAAMLEANIVPREDIVAVARGFLDALNTNSNVRISSCKDSFCSRESRTVEVVYRVWRRTNERTFIESAVLNRLTEAIARVSDSASLAEAVTVWRALGYLSEMLVAGGRSAEAEKLDARREVLADMVLRTFWDENASLYRSEKNGPHDVWGSAYAVWTGLAPAMHADAVAHRFKNSFPDFAQKGRILRTVSSSSATARMYPVGWFAYALERAAPDLTDRLYQEMRSTGLPKPGCDFLWGVSGALESIDRICKARAAAAKPVLHGDGISDDTAAIQMMLDSGRSCVYLPPPKKFYLISRALELESGQELRLDRGTVVKLAPKSDCHMLINRNWRTGDRNISVIGGIWDLDCARQSPNPHQGRHCRPPRKIDLPKTFQRDFFRGEIFCFDKLEGLVVRDVTFRNPTTYSLQMTRTSYFVIDGVVFDFDSWNPIPLNMDGIHCDGGCHHGKISNLRGTCFDDLVALNANDGICAAYEGPITDIDIDGIYAEYCHSAVRLLSAGADVKRITIRNIHGRFYTYTVGLTHYFPEKPRGRFDDIVLSDIFTSKAFAPEGIGVNSRKHYPPIWIEGPVDVGSLTIRNLSRDEQAIAVSSIRVDKVATVENLTIRDCQMKNGLAVPMPFFDLRGPVKNIFSENNVFVGNWSHLPQKGVIR